MSMTESIIDESTLMIILSVLAPAITMVIAKMKSQTTFFKSKLKSIVLISQEIDKIMEDDKVTAEEARKLISLVRIAIK